MERAKKFREKHPVLIGSAALFITGAAIVFSSIIEAHRYEENVNEKIAQVYSRTLSEDEIATAKKEIVLFDQRTHSAVEMKRPLDTIEFDQPEMEKSIQIFNQAVEIEQIRKKNAWHGSLMSGGLGVGIAIMIVGPMLSGEFFGKNNKKQ